MKNPIIKSEEKRQEENGWSVGNLLLGALILLITVHCSLIAVPAQTNEFTYQGKLNVSGSAASTPHDFQFYLCSANFLDCTIPTGSGGVMIDSDLTHSNVAITNGIFSVKLNFTASNAFDGSARWLEIYVKPNGSPGPYQMLSPRQPLTSAPYAIKSLNAGTATNSLQLGGVDANQYVTTTSGGTNYIQNTTTQQAANFNVSGNGIVGGNAGIGTTTPSSRLHILDNGANILLGNGSGCVSGLGGLGFASTLTCSNYSLLGDGISTIINRSTGGGIYFRENNSDQMAILSGGNVGIGTTAPQANLHLAGNSGSFAMAFTNTANTAGRRGYRIAFDNDRLTFQRADDNGNFSANQVSIDQVSGNVGIGTTSPQALLDVGSNHMLKVDGASVQINNPPVGPPNDGGVRLVINGVMVANLAGADAFSRVVCQNLNTAAFAVCPGSSIRFKENVTNYDYGLDLVRNLRPVSYTWKKGGQADFGLIAEEVAKEEPLLAAYDEKGEIYGVRYDRVGVIAINAIKEQQVQIESQQKLIEQQQMQINELKKIVCALNSAAGICQQKRGEQ